MITQLNIKFDNTFICLQSPVSTISREDYENAEYMALIKSCNKTIVIVSSTEFTNNFIFTPVTTPIKNIIKEHINTLMLKHFGVYTVTPQFVIN